MLKYKTLFEKGYYVGNISELNFDMDKLTHISNELYSYLNDKEKYFSYFSINNDGMPDRVPYSDKKLKKDFVKNNPENEPFNSSSNLLETSETKENIDYIKHIVKKFIHNVYPDLTYDKIDASQTIQMYEDGDYQNTHTDGHVGECVILIYLSNPKTYNNTGKFVLFGGENDVDVIDFVEPILGNYVILDLTKNDIKHRVEKITGDFVRFAYLCQIRKFENNI